MIKQLLAELTPRENVRRGECHADQETSGYQSHAEITPKELYLNRRQFMLSASAMALSAGAALGWLRRSGTIGQRLCRRETRQRQEELLQHQRKAKLV